MNWDRIEGEWKQMKGSVKEQWGKLTDDDLDVAAGKRDQTEPADLRMRQLIKRVRTPIFLAANLAGQTKSITL